MLIPQGYTHLRFNAWAPAAFLPDAQLTVTFAKADGTKWVADPTPIDPGLLSGKNYLVKLPDGFAGEVATITFKHENLGATDAFRQDLDKLLGIDLLEGVAAGIIGSMSQLVLIDDVQLVGVGSPTLQVQVTPARTFESDRPQLSISFTPIDPLQPTTLFVNWGDGSLLEEVNVPPGGTQAILFHTYVDDDPSGTPEDPYLISVVGDNVVGVGLAEVVIVNTEPIWLRDEIRLEPFVIDEGGEVELSAAWSDVGSSDTFTVEIDWGDGEIETLPNLGPFDADGSFTASHRYLDDDPDTGTASDRIPLRVTLRDDDGAENFFTANVRVNNLAPQLFDLALDTMTVEEGGSVTLTGRYSDASPLDTFTIEIDWGDGATDTLADLGPLGGDI